MLFRSVILLQLTLIFSFQVEDIRSISDVDDLSTTFSKVGLLNFQCIMCFLDAGYVY